MRPGDNKWGASIFARNPDTGEVKWVYQVTANDGWDYDAASENIAVDLKLDPADTTASKLLVHLNKNGLAYTFDRATGRIWKAEQFVDNVNWAAADAFNYTSGTQKVDESKRVHQDAAEKTKVCPSVLGGKGWEPGAFSPNTKLFYMPTFNFCSNLDALKAEFISGAPYMGADYDIKPDLPRPDGKFVLSELVAWDAVAGTDKWRISEPAMIYAGVLATAGDVVFYSTQAAAYPTVLPPALKAIDAKTGAPLWSASMTCNTVGNPITFMGPDGKQRVAVFSDDACANGSQLVSDGGRVHVYKLKP